MSCDMNLYFYKDSQPKGPLRWNHSPIQNLSSRNNRKEPSHDRLPYFERFSTLLNTTIIEVYIIIKSNEFVYYYPPPMKVTPYTCTFNKYYMFHQGRRHDTEQCYALNKEIERLITKYYIQKIVKRDTHIELGREESSQPNQVLLEINVILGGTLAIGDSGSGRKKYRKQVLTNMWHELIIFTLEDREGVTFTLEDALVISTVLAIHLVYRILMDDGTMINILSRDVMTQMGIDPSRLILINTLFIGIAGISMLVKGALEILVTNGTYSKCLTLQQTSLSLT